MHPDPVVAIIVPTLNRPQTLLRLVDSIRAQTYSDWVCIIINQGDMFPAALEPLLRRFVYVDMMKQSASLARNIGLGIAQALGVTYVCLIDDDDWIEPNYLEEMVGALESNPQAGLVACTGTYEGKTYRQDHPTTKLIGSRMVRALCIGDAKFTARSGQEKAFWRLFDGHKQVNIDKILYRASRHPTGGLRDPQGGY